MFCRVSQGGVEGAFSLRVGTESVKEEGDHSQFSRLCTPWVFMKQEKLNSEPSGGSNSTLGSESRLAKKHGFETRPWKQTLVISGPYSPPFLCPENVDRSDKSDLVLKLIICQFLGETKIKKLWLLIDCSILNVSCHR